MSDEIKTPTMKLYFNWKSLQPDHRQWKPSNPILEPSGYFIAIEIPLTTDLIINATAIATQQLTNQDEEMPILTPLGMRYCIDQFEAVMNDSGKVTTETTDDEWAKVDEEVPATPAKDDRWDETSDDETSTEKSDENWNEDWS